MATPHVMATPDVVSAFRRTSRPALPALPVLPALPEHLICDPPLAVDEPPDLDVLSSDRRPVQSAGHVRFTAGERELAAGVGDRRRVLLERRSQPRHDGGPSAD